MKGSLKHVLRGVCLEPRAEGILFRMERLTFETGSHQKALSEGFNEV